jgi:PIN domain nuclease of toxin-antitoxin system
VGGHEVNWLLDTNVWLLGYAEPERLPLEIQRILAARGLQFGLSAISLWEVAKKNQIGKLELKKELGRWLEDAISSHIQLLPLTPEIITDAMSLPGFPNRDPADELIVATARVHKLTLLTTDTLLKNYRHAKIHYFKPIEPKK